MKEYEVTLYFHTYLCVKVDAENEKEALEKARSQAECCTNAIIDSLQEEGNDVECIEPEVIEADTAGYMVKFPDEDEVFYVGSSCPPIGNGICYKDKQAFDDQQGICYVNEYGFYDEVAIDENVSDEMLAWMNKHNEWHVCMDDRGYTWDDLREEVYLWIGNQLDFLDDHTYDLFVDYMQERLFDELDWQSPDTWLYELDVMEQWENCPQLSCEDPRFDEHGNRKQ